jgi:hypothetical protein
MLCARSVSAHNVKSIGVTMGYPSSVGVLWHVTDGVALRPELSFVHTSNVQDAPLPIGGVETSGRGDDMGHAARLRRSASCLLEVEQRI